MIWLMIWGLCLSFFNRPTADDIEQFKSGHSFEIRMTEMYGVIMISAKIGTLNWIDMPYTPHLSKSLTKFQLPDKGEGLGLVLMLVDGVSGEIKSIRMLGLSENFTRKLYGVAMEQKAKDFDKAKYEEIVLQIKRRYTTKQIVSMSKVYCKINE